MKTVLVIDDEAPLRKTVRMILESAQYAVIEAANGLAGLQLFHHHHPELVITDILMPEKEGIETIREMRQADPRARILAISGGPRMGASDFLAMAHKLGAMETLRKPFRRNELLACVERVLARVQ